MAFWCAALCFQYVLSFVDFFITRTFCSFQGRPAGLLLPPLGPGPSGHLPSRAECHSISLAWERGIVKRKDRPGGARQASYRPPAFGKRLIGFANQVSKHGWVPCPPAGASPAGTAPGTRSKLLHTDFCGVDLRSTSSVIDRRYNRRRGSVLPRRGWGHPRYNARRAAGILTPGSCTRILWRRSPLDVVGHRPPLQAQAWFPRVWPSTVIARHVISMRARVNHQGPAGRLTTVHVPQAFARPPVFNNVANILGGWLSMCERGRVMDKDAFAGQAAAARLGGCS